MILIRCHYLVSETGDINVSLGWIIPELQNVAKNISLDCPDCFIPESAYFKFFMNFTKKEFCPGPGKIIEIELKLFIFTLIM